MFYPILVSISVGLCVVLQAGLNRKIAREFNLPSATLLTALSFLAAALVVYYITKEVKVSDRSHFSLEWGKIQWWYPIAGLFGYCVVVGIPYGISQIGAAKTILFTICTQIIASMLWDLYFENIPLSGLRIAGGLITMLGVLLVSLR